MLLGMNESLRIVVVAPDLAVADPADEHAVLQAERSRALRIGLLENNFNLVATLPADVFLSERIAQLQPDLIIVDAESEARDVLEHVVMATRDERRPIVMFTNDEDTSHVKDAVAAGVSAYIVAGPGAPAHPPHSGRGNGALPARTGAARRAGRRQDRTQGPQDHRPGQGPAHAAPGPERTGRVRETAQDRHGQGPQAGGRGAAHARCDGSAGVGR